ncbi:MAG: recombinase RecT [Candidatus Bipolaricaulis sp.]|nr:recombinase RecT [Candidatus Bipolaricaulis sp.]
MTTDLTTIQNNISEMLTAKAAALPKNFNQTRFVQNCITVLKSIDGIQTLEPSSIAQTMLKGAFLGLDFFNKECYAIPYGKELKFQTDYKGEIKLARLYAIRPVKDIYAKIVREGDEFEIIIDAGLPSVYFKPKPFNQSEIIGVFAVCVYKDGILNYDTMTKSDVESIRNNYSKAANSKAWKISWEEMAKKCVIRRLCKMIGLNFDNAEQDEAFQDGSDFLPPELEIKESVPMPKKLESVPTPDDPRTIPVTASPLPSAGLGKITEKEKADFLAKVQKMKKDCPPDDWARLITDFGEPDNIDTIENSNMFKKTLSGFVNAWLAKQNVISY